tara:strand:- start:495 stop:698 length:204 start_codon:yes stop_codon:yes gene_type:complete
MSAISVAVGIAISPFVCTLLYVIGYLTKRYVDTPGYSYKPVPTTIPNTTTEPFLEEKYFRYDPSDNV